MGLVAISINRLLTFHFFMTLSNYHQIIESWLSFLPVVAFGFVLIYGACVCVMPKAIFCVRCQNRVGKLQAPRPNLACSLFCMTHELNSYIFKIDSYTLCLIHILQASLLSSVQIKLLQYLNKAVQPSPLSYSKTFLLSQKEMRSHQQSLFYSLFPQPWPQLICFLC